MKSHAPALDIEEHAPAGRELHVYVPAGATPTDGPSAGITMVTAIASLLSGRPVKSTIGMTGEVTLQGRVLPIGGVKQKVLAAHAAGLSEVILPERNEPDLDDVPAEVRRGPSRRRRPDTRRGWQDRGGKSEYWMGRQNGLVASVSAGRIILTLTARPRPSSRPRSRARAGRPAPRRTPVASAPAAPSRR